MKRFFTICMFVMLAVATASAQQRIGCVHSFDQPGTRAAEVYSLPEPVNFDPQKIYRQPVVLISFNDTDFSMADPKAYYDRLFNEKGFNSGYGKGCAADYFREQSGGRVNLQFDIYGPIKVDYAAGGHGTRYQGTEIIRAALKQLYETETTNFSIYDWDGSGTVNQVLFMAAGFSGHHVAGYIWPNTGSLRAQLPGDINLFYASVSCELWNDKSLAGFGIAAHEFCHCLGLPDVYPLSPATIFSAVDEWDLMDGGDYTNKAWCPPNLSAMEKMYLGWGQPEELTEPTTITGMKPVSDGGKTYLIRNSGYSDEYYLLENRRQEGWDYGCPGNGLLIFHVDYQKKAWGNNVVNTNNNHFRYDLFHADGMSYINWDPANNGNDPDKYTMADGMRCKYLSTSSYPFTNSVSLVVNQMLTDESSPASKVFNKTAEGKFFMSKPISNIQLASDGTISFDFMKEASGIDDAVLEVGEEGPWYDLQGRRLSGKPTRKGVFIHNGRKIVI